MSGKLVPTPQAAARLGISARALNRWARAGVVVAAFRSPDGRLHWNPDELREQVARLPARYISGTAARASTGG